MTDLSERPESYDPKNIEHRTWMRRVLKYGQRAAHHTRKLAQIMSEHFGLDAQMNGLEIGVEKGHTSMHLLRLFPNLTLTLVDAWQAGLGTSDWSQDEADNNLISTLLHIRPHRDRTKILWMDSRLAAKNNGSSFDWIYCDGDHTYEGHRSDLLSWFYWLSDGGLWVGDDYNSRNEREGKGWGVKRAADEYAAEHGLEIHKERNLYWIYK